MDDRPKGRPRGRPRKDPHRLVTASSRVSLGLTATARLRVRQLALLHSLTVSALIRSAVEALVAGEADAGPPVGPPPPPEPLAHHLTIALMPETAEAVDTLAVRNGVTKTAVIRECARCGGAGHRGCAALRPVGAFGPSCDRGGAAVAGRRRPASSPWSGGDAGPRVAGRGRLCAQPVVGTQMAQRGRVTLGVSPTTREMAPHNVAGFRAVTGSVSDVSRSGVGMQD